MAVARDPLALVEQAAVAEEVLAVIRHDMANRLSTLRNAAFFVRRKVVGSTLCAEDPRLERMLLALDEEVGTASAALEEGSAVARLGARRRAPMDAGASVRAGAELARIPGGSIQIDVAAEPGQVAADPDEIALAVRCLVENAAEAMPDGGAVSVRAAPQRGGRFLVEVRDEGPGIAEADHDAVLRAFYTTKAGRAGLGLAIARRIARAAGGGLQILPSEIGAAVMLSLPLAGA